MAGRKVFNEQDARRCLSAVKAPTGLGEAVLEALLDVPGVGEVFADDAELERRMRALLRQESQPGLPQ